MPFFEDISSDDEVLRRPIWGVFALVKDNLERLIAVNIGWALQLIPALAALSFPAIPVALRAVMLLYSAVVMIPATAMLYALMARVCRYETLRLDMLKEDFRALVGPAFRNLLPLFALPGLLFGLAQIVSFLHILPLDVLVRFLLLVQVIGSFYYGPLFADEPTCSPLVLLQQSALLVWRYPGQTMLTAVVVVAALLLGTISVGGLFLIVPVLIALLQTRRCHELMAREQVRLRGGQKSKEMFV